MSAITWRNVNAPNFAASNLLLDKASDRMADAFTSGRDILKGMHEEKTDRLTGEAKNLIANLTDRETLAADAAGITGQFDSRYLDQGALAEASNAQQKNLLNNESTMLDMAAQRYANQIAPEAHALNMQKGALAMRKGEAALITAEGKAAQEGLALKGSQWLNNPDVANTLFNLNASKGPVGFNRDIAISKLLTQFPNMDMAVAIKLADQAENMSGDVRRDAAAFAQLQHEQKKELKKLGDKNKTSGGKANNALLDEVDENVTFGTDAEGREHARMDVAKARLQGMTEKEISYRINKAKEQPFGWGAPEWSTGKFWEAVDLN